jgi:tetratricopeptide (TPR) repeat protein
MPTRDYEVISKLLQQRKYVQARQLLMSDSARELLKTKDGLNLFGVCERALGRPANAVRAYLMSLQINMKQAGVWTNLGNAYKDLNKLASSLECHKIALDMSSIDDVQILHNMGIAASLENNHALAISLFEKALSIDSQHVAVRWDLARSQLALFDYKNGWLNYQYRWSSKDAGPRRYQDKLWLGEPLTNRIIFVYAEQGFGDYIQCVRFVRDLIALNPHQVQLEVKPELWRLIQNSFADLHQVKLVSYREKNDHDAFDCCISVVDLPLHFVDDYSSLRQSSHYLSQADALNELAPSPIFSNADFKIGIVWSGSLTFKRNNFRSTELKNFINSFSIPAVKLYSLQMGEKKKDTEAFASQLVSLDSYINDFSDTVRLLFSLDLVITTCTSMVHLCGAIGKPCWVLLDYSPHWLWGTEVEDTNWYPSVRLFRQRTPGGWYELFDRVQGELMCSLREQGRYQ